VKTKSLTPWCNLYSIASKFEIRISPSRYKVILYSATLSIFIAAPLFYFSVNLYLLACFSLIVFIGISLLKYRGNSIIDYFIKDKRLEKFTITNEGFFQFYTDRGNSTDFKLTPFSRVSFLGCWLVYSSQKNPDNLKAKFIFKDSLSSADYSRLRRVITALKSLP